ncbi:MAG: PEP-CTERM sorting domain-containing protein, partial [Opitutales bacterium]|nr:PEP-CTERM sorting domain-containing protein [Opitutales bacterium]
SFIEDKTMKNYLISFCCAAAFSASAFATDYVMYGATTAEGAFVYSSTDVAKQPWDAQTIPTASDRILWVGTQRSSAVLDPGYIAIDNDVVMPTVMVSGSGGQSPLHFILNSDVYTSDNFTVNSSLVNLNGHYTSVYFDGKGTVTFANNSGINLTSSNANATHVVFGADTAIETTGNFGITGKNTGGETRSNVIIYGAMNVQGNLSGQANLILSGSALKYVRDDFAASGSTAATVRIIDNANVSVGHGIASKGNNTLSIESGTVAAQLLTITDTSTTSITGGTLTLTGNTTVSSGSRFIVGAGGTVTMRNLVINTGTEETQSTTIINGDVTINALSFHNYNYFTVGETGKITVNAAISLAGNTTTAIANNPRFVINSAGNEINGNFFMPEFGSFRVTADNDWNSSLLLRGGRTNVFVENNATLEVNGLLSVSTVSGKTSNISVESGSVLLVGSTMGTIVQNDITYVGFGELDGSVLNYLNIVSFEENTIAFKEIGNAAQQDAFLSRVTIGGAYSEDLRFSDFDSSIGGYWLTTAPIPEPSTWAAIFGAVALGFAAYRRRK